MSAALPVRHAWRDALVFSTDDRVDGLGLAVTTALHVHMSPEGRCSVGLRRLASISRCSVPTVRKRRGALVDAGWLEVECGSGERAVYRAVIPAAEAPVEAAVDEPVAEQPGAPTVQPQRADCATRLHTYPCEPHEPLRRARSSTSWHDPSVGRPPPDRPPLPPPEVVVDDDGRLWVGAAR